MVRPSALSNLLHNRKSGSPGSTGFDLFKPPLEGDDLAVAVEIVEADFGRGVFRWRLGDLVRVNVEAKNTRPSSAKYLIRNFGTQC
jgi:hypothetical protein